jgi:1-acyl-sn-glycerol-3-phosphate acyltransferase
MSVPQLLLVFAGSWLAVVGIGWLVVGPVLRRSPGGRAVDGLIWNVARVYARLWHRPTYAGREIIPRTDDDHDGLVVISNHTGALDPLLIQAGCRFLIRWMMAGDMMSPALDWLWSPRYVLPVARDGTDSGPLREAIRHVKGGGAIGIFPEGRITVPPRELRPFLPGVGLVVTRTRAPVLVAWVSGTPETNKMGEALATPSHARVEFLEIMEFPDERDPAVITEAIRRRIHEASGWPFNEEVIPPGGAPEDEDDAG